METLHTFFLFSDAISPERINWLSFLFASGCKFSEIYLTGEALYSLIDSRTSSQWQKIHQIPHIRIYIDWGEAQLMGIEFSLIASNFLNKIQEDEGVGNQMAFWENLVSRISVHTDQSIFGVFSNEGPYLFRNSVYTLRLAQAIAARSLELEYYAYLDGLHSGHAHQKPSEFENIGQGLSTLFQDIMNQDNVHDPHESKTGVSRIFACSRCATARGYWDKDRLLGSVDTTEVIPHFQICNLNEIVKRFECNFPILMVNSGLKSMLPLFHEGQFPIITIFITRSPYHTEHAFGGLSFAITCANHHILTNVFFIEDGIYTLYGEHAPRKSEKIFNLQEIIEATEEEISYFAYGPSIHTRGLEHFPRNFEMKILTGSDLETLVNQPNFHQRYLIF